MADEKILDTENVSNFIHDIIDSDLAEGRVKEIHTRFPPEPNGYLHIGSAKAIWINSGTAQKYHGLFNLRFDAANPVREDDEYVKSIEEDLRWLGAEPTGGSYYGSDYFDQCYEFALKLIREGKAYVDDLSADEMREYRGTLTEPGKESPYRNRSVEENLDLFERMKNGEFPEGRYTLRAKIDLESGNFNMRDPVLYRIRYIEHHRQGTKWCIFPMYDFAHPIQDALEGITHSLCSLEFENHRPLYNWVVEHCDLPSHPRQIEFARLGIDHTVLSKRKLRKLVEEGVLPRTPVKHFVAGISAGIIDDAPMLDLPYSEDSRAMVDRYCGMNELGEIIELQGTGEGRAFTAAEQQELVELCAKGCRELIRKEKDILGEVL